ncbi:universal stress protein [Youngiibacter multivorans]|uniref:Nucleotide-binding universal stress UspA family protein n=1 Tax=Youngiibacter multivorans TaxID=937251 RepID=A0ABS4G6R4_9CLOT|nr:universal stress protein [Youngiibacter multivorans]MBP1920216.1 nucleotide-binding universal stress UspA family protein [Youngiibacter multivorans]
MYKKILVATDGSDYSRRAFEVALEMAKHFQSELEILHVIQDYMKGESNVEVKITKEQVEAVSKEIMEKTKGETDTGEVRITTKTAFGYPASVIIEEANAGFDLIVMGTKGHGPWGGAIMGSVTQRVAGAVNCPVLVVK